MKTLLQRIKDKWNRYLEKLAATNEKLYGNGRLDCCDMHQRGQAHKQ